jgi:DNA-binding MarR family transcriptional regulator
VIVGLSAEGRRLLDRFRRRRQEIFSEALVGMSEAEQKQALEVLEKVVEALENYEGSASFKAENNSNGKKARAGS